MQGKLHRQEVEHCATAVSSLDVDRLCNISATPALQKQMQGACSAALCVQR